MEPFAWLDCPDPRLGEALAYLAERPGKQLRSRLTALCAELIAGKPLASADAAAARACAPATRSYWAASTAAACAACSAALAAATHSSNSLSHMIVVLSA